MRRKKSPQLDLFARPERIPEPDLTRFDWIVISTSGGKDSQAMLDLMCTRAEASGVLHRVVVVHADLGRVEWPGTKEIAAAQAERYGVRFVVVRRGQNDILEHTVANGYWPKPDTRFCTSDHKVGPIKTLYTALADEARESDLLTQIETRGRFPGPDTRFCTAHHKQGPVGKVFTALTTEANKSDLLSRIEERGKFPDQTRRFCTSDHKRAPVQALYTSLTGEASKEGRQRRGRVRILSCMGMRAEESPARAKRQPLVLNRGRVDPETGKRGKGVSSRRRFVWDYLPLHHWAEAEVWARIEASRTADLKHYCYGLGMPRCSCCFCIFAPRDALIIAGHHNPELLAEYVRIEEKIGHRFRMNLSMAEVQQAVLAGEKPAIVTDWRM